MEGLKLRSTSMPAPRAYAYSGTGRPAYVLDKKGAILALSFFTGFQSCSRDILRLRVASEVSIK